MRSLVLACGLVALTIAHAHNRGPAGTKDTAGWGLPYDALYNKVQSSRAKNWTLKLHTREFPFAINQGTDQICFQDDKIYRPPHSALAAVTKTPHCCFVMDHTATRAVATDRIDVNEVHLEPLPPRATNEGKLASFRIKYPENVFTEFYCSTVEPEKGKAHLPSLAEINSALNLSFGMTADEI